MENQVEEVMIAAIHVVVHFVEHLSLMMEVPPSRFTGENKTNMYAKSIGEFGSPILSKFKTNEKIRHCFNSNYTDHFL